MIFVTWPGGKSLSKQVWSHRDKILPRQGDRWETLARSSWRGLMLGGIRSGYGVIFYLVVTQLLGGWVPLDNPYTALFATPLPFLGPLAGGLIPAMSEELLFRLVGISLILWLTGRRWLALLVPGVLWAFAHLAYVRDPFYLRGLELTVVAVLYGLFFLRFDLTTVIVAHFTYNASLGMLPLIRSGEPYFVASGLIIIAAMLAPVLPSLVRTVRRRRRQIPDRPLPQIRLADSNDLKAIARLPVETLDWSTLITDPDSALLCLQSSDELAGFVAGRVTAEGHSEVLVIYVAPGWRRRYWGSRLVEALRAGLAARGGVSVQVTVSADDRVCTAFWASQGWRPAVKRFTSSLTAPAHPHWRGLLKQLKTVFRQ
jgi:membrane protease YdiL (CAAX protease family)/GNAT superfamily N-acetyltransferase